MSETWRAVVGFEGRYEVSDQGRVRSLRVQHGKVRREPLILREITRNGYRWISLGAAKRQVAVHRLVLGAFVGPCPPDHETGHLNGIRDDNRLVNLRWITRQENAEHKALHGTLLVGDANPARRHPERLARGDRNGARLYPERLTRGEDHRTAKLTYEQVSEIRRVYVLGRVRQQDLADRFGVSQTVISSILRGRTWRPVDRAAELYRAGRTRAMVDYALARERDLREAGL